MSALRIRLLVLVVITGSIVVGCGGSGSDDDTPDEVSFCRMVDHYERVAEAPVGVLQRLDELAPDEIDDAVVVLRQAAEELDEHRPGSSEQVEAEFEVRFRPEHIAARRQVDAYVAATCREAKTTTVPTTSTVPTTTVAGAVDPTVTGQHGDDEIGDEPNGTQD